MQLIRQNLLLLAAASAVAGCRPSVAHREADERRIPAMRQAMAREQAGDMAGAIARYEEALLEAPRAASAHLALGLLLHDSKQDYVGAIYHYRRYLAMQPETRKAEMVNDRLRVAEQLLAAQSLRKLSPNEGGAQAILMQQIHALNQRLAQAETEKAQLGEANQKLQAQVNDLQGQVSRLQRWVDRLQMPGGSGAPSGSGSRSLLPAGGRTYEVKQGDSLSRIAESVYGDPTQWPRIRDANRDKLQNGERVRPGDILAIP